MPQSYEAFLSEVQKASSNEERIRLAFLGLANSVLVRRVEALDEMNLKAIAKNDPLLYTSVESSKVREALVLTAFFRFSLEKGVPEAKEIELEDLPSCSKKDFVRFCSLFAPQGGKTKDLEFLPPDQCYLGVDAARTFLKSIRLLVDLFLPIVNEQQGKPQPSVPFMNATPKDVGILKTVLEFGSRYLSKNEADIHSLLNFSSG